jgi:hypothetical protein
MSHEPEIIEVGDDYVEDVEDAEDAEDNAEESYDDDDSGADGGDAEMDLMDGLAQIAQLFVTEDGTPIADVIVGVRDALEKLNKIVFKAVQHLEKSA